MKGQVEHLNPAGLLNNPAFSQAIVTQGNGKTVYIGGQNAVTASHEIVGKGDLAMQTEYVLKNILTALTACGASYENVVKLSIYIQQGQSAYDAFLASQKIMGKRENPPVISVLIVAGFAHPDFLIEIEATAFIPE